MSLRHLTVRIHSHGFVAYHLSARGRWLCSTFAKNFVQYGFISQRGQPQKVAVKVYAAATENRDEFRFHINCLTQFKDFLRINFVEGDLVGFETAPEVIAQPVDFVVKPMWVAKDYQVAVIDYLERHEPISKFVDLQTGLGKTFCALQGIATYGKRLAIIVKPMYVEKWVADVLKTYEIDAEEILVIKGSAQLMGLLMLAKEGRITEKVIIISNKTFQNWLKLYEKYGAETIDMGYACTPQNFYEYLHVGMRLIDEAHQDFHLGFKMDLYTHVPQSISLSATMINNDAFMEKMYELAYPLKERFRGLALKKYIDAFAVHYNFRNPERIKTEEFGGRGYSHMALEKSVMKHAPTLNGYFNLIEYVIDISFMKVVRKPKKLIVFASSIQMCTFLTQHFQRRYPHLDVRRYVEDDPQTNLHQGDITFTTLLSAGTAHDVANLTTVILTTAVNSIQSNVQGLGRLRELSDSPTEFYYFCNDDTPKHLEYHHAKVKMLEKRAKSFKDIYSGHVL